MRTLSGLSATAFQKFQVPVNGCTAEFILKYNPATRTWLLDIVCDAFILYNLRICHNLNLLAQYSDLITWGLYVTVIGIVEPVLIDDFSSGRAELNILTADEVELIEGGYSVLK